MRAQLAQSRSGRPRLIRRAASTLSAAPFRKSLDRMSTRNGLSLSVLQPSGCKNEKFPVSDVIDYPDHAGSGLDSRSRGQQLRNVDVGICFLRFLRQNQ